MKASVIVNPLAVGGPGGRRWKRIARALDAAFPGTWTATFPESAAGLSDAVAAQRRSDADRLCVVGGDGTVRCAVAGWVRGEDPRRDGGPALALLPAGTGNDFARGLGLPRDPVRAIEIAAGPDVRTVDLATIACAEAPGGEVAPIGVRRGSDAQGGVPHEFPLGAPRASGAEERRQGSTPLVFGNVAECGFGATVARRAATSSRILGAKATFRIAVARSLLSLSSAPVEVKAETPEGPFEWSGESVGVIFANGPHFGAGMTPAPLAKWDDGWLDIVILGAFSRREIIRHFGKIARGVHLGHSKVTHFRARSIRVTSPVAVPVEADGDACGFLPVEVRVLPAALRVCAPAGPHFGQGA